MTFPAFPIPTIRRLALCSAAVILAACSANVESEPVSPAPESTKSVAAQKAKKFDAVKIDKILAAQPDAAKARYQYRHPKETLEFFGIAPGMKVGEALPGGGWYSKILAPYLGKDGELVGIDYAYDMWPEFDFADETFMAGKKNWAADWTAKSSEWTTAGDAKISATVFAGKGQPRGTLDAVLFIRALHNMSRFEANGGYLTQALKDTHAMLKPGGIVGVVQHRAPKDADAAWADGSAGYLKRARVIAAFEAAGFEFIGESDINANPLDKPTSDDIVWRLPPSLRGVGDDAALRKARVKIGESNRMTLKFRKR